VSGSLLPAVAAILVLGLAVQLLARRLRVPSVVFYLALGVILGPEVLDIVTLETFGDGLETIVGLSVAIIVFDGAFQLNFDRVREAQTTSLRLVTIGAVLMFAGVAVAVRLLEGASWEISLLIGALLVATGPTVITPILEIVRVREHVATALETEGIINDVTAAIGAVVIFETLLLDDLGVQATVREFITRFGVGIVSGLLATVILYYLVNHEITPSEEILADRFLILSGAIGSFALAEAVAAEAGVAAAATAGIGLGNLELEHREEIEEFAREATLIVLAFVFVSLAALIDIDAIRELGFGAILLVLVVMLVFRPLVAIVSTLGVDRFSWPERLFIAAVGPRGIIPASVATLFAIELELEGSVTEGELLVGTVFAVIFATVAIEAGFARQIGKLLKVSPMKTVIVGGGRVGRALAERLEDRGEFVVIVEDDDELCEQARSRGFTVHEGDGSEPRVLRDAGIEEAKTVVAATGDDDVNLLVCQITDTKFDVEDIYSRVSDPENVDAFDSLDVTAIDSPLATAVAIDDEIEAPALTHWMNEMGDDHDVREIEVTADDLVGKSIEDVNSEIPNGCIVATVGQNDETRVPSAEDILNYGEHITFVGDADAVDRATKRFHPHD
jgi:NhaP-type Na+/H+ or K+/H+ antiporter